MTFKISKPNNYKALLPKYRIETLICLLFMLAPFMQYAQTNELTRHYTKYDQTFQLDNTQKNQAESITQELSEKGATWLRLFFKNVNLGNNSTITITSQLDGATQVLNSKTIKGWKNTSAYFNGDALTITLSIDPNDSSVGFTIYELGVGEPDPVVRSQCGANDDRRDSNDAAIGRMVPIGCTGWIISNGRLVTAGHCANSRAQIIEFNVPKSNPNRSIVHPGPEDQYPIGDFVTPYSNSPRPANDWAVFRASANAQTGLTPIQAQGKSFNVVQDAPGNNITITGFGTDTGIDNQTQQIHTGPTTSSDGTFVRYRTDTTGGNSGSPIIDAATGNAVGVHAYGGCSGSGGSNFGERATIPAFWDAMGLSGTTPPPSGGCNAIDFDNVQISSFSNQDVSGDFDIQNGGGALRLQNNTWKSIALNYTVTANTVLEFEFSSTSQGEIHAIGFENDNSLTSARYFRVYGTQNYGVGNFDDYSGSGTKKYIIPVGNFYTGAMNRLVIINDNDADSGNTSVFSNIKISEGPCNSLETTESLIESLESTEAIVGNEKEGILSDIKISPNPAKESFSIYLNEFISSANVSIYSILGQKQVELELTPGVHTLNTQNLSLVSGIYLIKMKSEGETSTRKLIVQ